MKVTTRALLAVAVGLAAVAIASPANALYSASIEGTEGCDAYALRDYTWAKTGKTTTDPCSLHGLQVRVQPVGGTAYTSVYTWRLGSVTLTAPSGSVTNSWHSVVD